MFSVPLMAIIIINEEMRLDFIRLMKIMKVNSNIEGF